MVVSRNDFKRLKAEIVYRVLDNEHINDECEFYEASFDNDENNYIHAKANIIPDDDLKVYFSIPHDTQNIFITVSDGASNTIRKIIGNIEQIDISDLSYFTRQRVVRFDNAELNKEGVFGIALLPLSVSGILDTIEECFDFNEINYCFRLVTMLSESEIKVWEREGFDALMAFFDSGEKDLLTFKQVVS